MHKTSKTTRRSKLLFSACALALVTGFTATEASAQVEGYSNEIIVTARKKEENLQDVPLSVAALGEEQIDAQKIRDLSDVSTGIPNVSFQDVGTQKGTANFSIRGLGINSSIPSIDPTVGTFVDNVYLGVNAGLVFDVFDLEGIEVLRGPQGILFGRNVTGGAVLLRTKRPGNEFEGQARVAVDGGGDGGLNTYVMGSVGGPIGDNVRAKIAGYYNKDDGWFENLNTGENFGKLKQFMIRPVIEWEPSANTELFLKYEYTEIDGDGPNGQSHTNGSGVPGSPVNFDRDSFDFSINTEGYHRSKSHFATAEFSVFVGASGQITNIAGYRNLSQDSLADLDAQPISLFDARFQVESEQFSNELRYTGPVAEGLDLTAGLYYFQNQVGYGEGRRLLGAATPTGAPALTQDGGGDYNVKTYAAFLTVDYALSSQWSILGGLRYTFEEKSVEIASLSLNVNSPCSIIDDTCAFDFTDDASWKSLDPKIGLSFEPRGDVLIYSHWARGHRSGGYNLRNTAADTANFGPGPFDQETVDNFEIGWKTNWDFGRINGAVFYNNIRDMQREVLLTDPTSGVVQLVRNTADAEILGFELDGVFFLSPSLVLDASIGYIDADYTDIFFDLSGDGVINQTDYELAIPRAADLTWSIGLNHDLPIGSWGTLSSRVSYSYRAEEAFSDDNRGYIDPQDILNAGLDLRTTDDRWTFSIYGRNLLNSVKHGGDGQLPSNLGPFPLGGTFAPLTKGRVIGAQITLDF
ncbi:TonB-dependent receptor [Citromicrobium sp. JLT1363]|uniref:TonB-dependent receptor n=1 Tax=Citromicrobium sp. JLT1363 TaxID=517722 RepID=UPI000225E94F|nr:TonB-dependent receptor [Citromicrobium sp. JLT1363]